LSALQLTGTTFAATDGLASSFNGEVACHDEQRRSYPAFTLDVAASVGRLFAFSLFYFHLVQE
jgi:hypothetical protein